MSSIKTLHIQSFLPNSNNFHKAIHEFFLSPTLEWHYPGLSEVSITGQTKQFTWRTDLQMVCDTRPQYLTTIELWSQIPRPSNRFRSQKWKVNNSYSIESPIKHKKKLSYGFSLQWVQKSTFRTLGPPHSTLWEKDNFAKESIFSFASDFTQRLI